MKSSLTYIAIFSFLSAKSAFSAPFDLIASDNIGTKRNVSIDHRTMLTPTTNLTMSPWPTKLYALDLGDNYQLVIIDARPYVKRPLPNIPPIQGFFRDFATNLERAYPPPALAPREAGQSYYDTDSFTRWDVAEWVIPLLCMTAPSRYIIAALVQLEREVARHGSPALLDAGIFGPHGSKPQAGFNSIKFSITPLQKDPAGNVVDAISGFASTS